MTTWLQKLITEKNWLQKFFDATTVEESRQTYMALINCAIEQLAESEKPTKIADFNQCLQNEIRNAIANYGKVSDLKVSKLLFDIARINHRHRSDQYNEYTSLYNICYKILLKELASHQNKERKEKQFDEYNATIKKTVKSLLKIEMTRNKENYLSILISLNEGLKIKCELIAEKLAKILEQEPIDEKSRKHWLKKKNLLTNLLEDRKINNVHTLITLQRFINDKITAIENGQSFTLNDMNRIYVHFESLKYRLYINIQKFDSDVGFLKALILPGSKTKKALVETLSNLSTLFQTARNDTKQAARLTDKMYIGSI